MKETTRAKPRVAWTWAGAGIAVLLEVKAGSVPMSLEGLTWSVREVRQGCPQREWQGQDMEGLRREQTCSCSQGEETERERENPGKRLTGDDGGEVLQAGVCWKEYRHLSCARDRRLGVSVADGDGSQRRDHSSLWEAGDELQRWRGGTEGDK